MAEARERTDLRASGWFGVELRHFAALQAVAAHGSFKRAGRQLGYTQSAISQQIAALERIVGHRLFERSGGPGLVTLTDAGRLVLGHADAMVARVNAAHADLRALTDEHLLRVGANRTAGAWSLPLALCDLVPRFPQLELRLLESVADEELLGAIERGELDLAFAHLPLDAGPFACEALPADRYALLVPRGSALARAPELAEVLALPVMTLRRSRSADQLLTYLGSMGLRPRLRLRSDDVHTLAALVAAGFANALLPVLALGSGYADVEAIELPALPPRRLALVWHRDRQLSDAAHAFVSAVVATLDRDSTSALAAAASA